MESLSQIRSQLPPNCQILAVSKLQSPEQIRTLYRQGQRHFAENYVQEALEKQKQVNEQGIVWHFIGSLQTNKVKDVVGSFEFIHSVDRESLIQEIQKQAAKKNVQQKVFLQVNLAAEETKGGCTEDEIEKLISQIQGSTNILLVGLMCMPPLVQNPELSRPYFQKMKSLLNRFQKKMPSITQLSMGTSADYLVAAEEGATFVRLGTILFGERGK